MTKQLLYYIFYIILSRCFATPATVPAYSDCFDYVVDGLKHCFDSVVDGVRHVFFYAWLARIWKIDAADMDAVIV